MNVIRLVPQGYDRQLRADEAPALVIGTGRCVLPDPAASGAPLEQGVRLEFIADGDEGELLVLCRTGSSVRIFDGSQPIKTSTAFTVESGRWVIATATSGPWLVTSQSGHGS